MKLLWIGNATLRCSWELKLITGKRFTLDNLKVKKNQSFVPYRMRKPLLFRLNSSQHRCESFTCCCSRSWAKAVPTSNRANILVENMLYTVYWNHVIMLTISRTLQLFKTILCCFLFSVRSSSENPERSALFLSVRPCLIQ